jgi:hypothetical protein
LSLNWLSQKWGQVQPAAAMLQDLLEAAHSVEWVGV